MLVGLGNNLREEERKLTLTEHLPCSKAALGALRVDAHMMFMVNIRGGILVY